MDHNHDMQKEAFNVPKLKCQVQMIVWQNENVEKCFIESL